MVSIKGLSKPDVLAALYNRARPQGMGFIHYTPEDMTKEQAELLLQQTNYFDYVRGRAMKVDLSSDEEFDERLYDRDNGFGAAQSAINTIKTGRS